MAKNSDEDSIPSSTNYTYYNRTFDDINDLFLYACTHGDYMLVYNLLESGKVKVDIKNRMGKSALELAIEKEHLEVVKVLLNLTPYEQFRDALLLAIYLGHIAIADFILNHQTYRTFEGGYLDPKHPQAYDDSQFSSDITPLILAAQHNRLLIVHQLLLNGERIKKPHIHMCSCFDCIENSASDSFRQAQIRLSAYKGLASEVYIALAYPDPILQAFELGSELRKLAKIEHSFNEEYKKLSNQLSRFVARLLDNVRGHEELEIILNKTGRPCEEKYEILSRFDLAIQYQEKSFVSHSNCQQKLMENWYRNLSIIKNSYLPTRLLFYTGFIICYPFLALTFYLFPKSKIGSLCQQPNLKFKAYIASYFIFIGLIIASSTYSGAYLEKTKFLSNYNITIYKNYIEFIYKNNELKNKIININENNINLTIDSFINCDISLRFMEPNLFQIAISIWVIGFFWNEFKQIASVGIRVYLKTASNYIDCLMNILYILYFIFLYSTMIVTRLSMNIFQSYNYWNQLSQFNNMSINDQKYYTLKTRYIIYWLNADRFYWKNNDLQNLAEAFFAMGNVFSICRICFLLPISAFVGPLQVILDRTITHISKWIIIILIFFIAFACSLYLIYSFYAFILEEKNSLINSTINSNFLIINNTKCPEYFFEILNQSINLQINEENNNNNIINNENSFCQGTSAYSTMIEIGYYPAIYYFGRSFETTLLTIFFSLFGVIGEDNVPDRGYELLTQTCYQPDIYSYRFGFDIFTSNLGFIIYGMFTFICVTVLINTLIAMLEKTIKDFDNQADDIEWKFARSKLYMEYIRDGNTLPVPMNILPSPISIMNIFNRIKRMFLSKTNNNNNKKIEEDYSMHINMGRIVNNQNIKFDDLKTKKNFNFKRNSIVNERLTYKIVIQRVIKRFLLYYKDSRFGLNDIKEITEFREVKNDITAFRFEILYQIDQLDEIHSNLIQTMNKFDENLKNYFHIEQIKQYLKNS